MGRRSRAGARKLDKRKLSLRTPPALSDPGAVLVRLSRKAALVSARSRPVSPIRHELDFDEYAADWADHLRAENKSENTVTTYGYGVASLRAFVDSKRWELDLAAVSSKRIGAWLRSVLASSSDATARNYYHGARGLFSWLVNEGELEANPFDGISPPTLEEKIVPVISTHDLRELVHACFGEDFRAVRDMAIVRLFVDCGVRLAELTNVELDDLDKRTKSITVTGKGSKSRVVHYGPKAAVALNRYLRLRARHPLASSSKLWLGKRGTMTRSGLYQTVRARAEARGLRRAPAPIPSHIRARVEARGRERLGANGILRMERCEDAQSLREERGERASSAHARAARTRGADMTFDELKMRYSVIYPSTGIPTVYAKSAAARWPCCIRVALVSNGLGADLVTPELVNSIGLLSLSLAFFVHLLWHWRNGD